MNPSAPRNARTSQYEAWRAFINGKQAPASTPSATRPTTYNYARTLIRKTASYVFPDAVAFNVVDDQGEPLENNDTERLLAALYSALSLHEFDVAQEEERSIIGDAAEKITWDTATNAPRVVSVDPATLTAKWTIDNPTVAEEIHQEYVTPGWALEPYGIHVNQPDSEFRVLETWTRDTWRLSVPQAGYDEISGNPYGWIPYLVLPNRPENRSFWGQSDLVDIVEPARDFNRALTTLGTIIDFSGAPITILENVSGSEGIRVRPGAKWELPANSKAYLLDLLEGGSLDHHNKYIDQLRTTLHDISETPRTAFGDTGRALSGAALEIEIQPMTQKVKRKRASWSRHYAQRNRRLLDLLDRFGSTPVGPDRNTIPIWPPILPADDDALVRQQTALVAAGIRSRYTANKALGVADPEAEMDRIATESTQETNTNGTDDLQPEE